MPKPKTHGLYSADVTRDCERVLVTYPGQNSADNIMR
jgi:hypothetical protein